VFALAVASRNSAIAERLDDASSTQRMLRELRRLTA